MSLQAFINTPIPGATADSKDLHLEAENVDIALAEANVNSEVYGRVISKESGKIVAFNGIPYGVVADDKRLYKLNNYSNCYQIGIARKGVRYLQVDVSVRSGDLLTALESNDGILSVTADPAIAIATAEDDAFDTGRVYSGSSETMHLAKVSFNFDFIKTTAPTAPISSTNELTQAQEVIAEKGNNTGVSFTDNKEDNQDITSESEPKQNQQKPKQNQQKPKQNQHTTN